MTKVLRIIKTTAAAGLLVAGAVSTAAAQTLSEARAREAEERALKKEAQYTASVCGATLNARINWSSTRSWPDGVSIAGKCDAALGALESVCRSDAGRSKAKSIKTFVCSGDGSGPSLSGGTLTFGASPSGNGFGETKSYLDRNL